MKTPKFLTQLSAVLSPRPKKRLHTTARAARPAAMSDYEEEEPTTKLSSAFIVVLILHIVAVGGIYAFNSIKASRRNHELATIAASTPALPSPTAVATGEKPPLPQPSVVAMNTKPPRIAENPAAAAPQSPASPPKLSVPKVYEVKLGDSVTKIAFAYGVPASELIEANHLKDSAALRAGQTLIIPAAKSTAKPLAGDSHKPDATPKPAADIPPTKTTPGLYTVKKNDTPTSIAKNFGLTAEELLKANKGLDPKKLQPGQALKVPPRKG